MGKSSKKSINTNRPARRARRGTAAATETVATAAVTAAPDDVTPTAPATEASDAPATEAAPVAATSRQEVQQLAFYYYAESGYVNGHALDHWLRAEHELTGS